MNFNQSPGFYDKNDNLIMDYKDAIKEKIIEQVEDIDYPNIYYVQIFRKSCIEKPFYLILPRNIQMIFHDCFKDCENLIGISGENVFKIGFQSFSKCENLEKINFPSLQSADSCSFEGCNKLLRRYTSTSGLVIVDNILINTDNYKREELEVSEKITCICNDAFWKNKTIKKLILPQNLYSVYIVINKDRANIFDEIVLPLSFKDFHYDIAINDSKLVYKGSSKQFEQLLKDKIVDEDVYKKIVNAPLTIEEMRKYGYSIKEARNFLNRDLTMDEMFLLGYTISEINKYFKEKE